MTTYRDSAVTALEQSDARKHTLFGDLHEETQGFFSQLAYSHPDIEICPSVFAPLLESFLTGIYESDGLWLNYSAELLSLHAALVGGRGPEAVELARHLHQPIAESSYDLLKTLGLSVMKAIVAAEPWFDHEVYEFSIVGREVVP